MTKSLQQQRRSGARSRRSHQPYEIKTATETMKSNIVDVRQQPVHSSNKSSVAGLLMDGTHPHLWLTKDNININFRELLHSIRCRPSMTELSIYHIHSNFTKNEFAILYDTIASGLPQLVKFSLWTCQPFKLSVLTNFLQKAINLQTISLQSVQLNSCKDTADFANALLQHPSLTHVELDMVQITAPGLTLDPLLHAIARNPRITTLRITTLAAAAAATEHHLHGQDEIDTDDEDSLETTSSFRGEREMVVNSDCLIRLCNNGHLQELVLCGVELNDTMMEHLAHSLSRNRHLDTLCLRNCGPYFTQRGTEAFMKMLHSNGAMQTLQLDAVGVGNTCRRYGDSVGGTKFVEEADDHDDEGLQLLPSDLQWWIDLYLHLNKTDTRRTLLLLFEDDDGEEVKVSPGDWLEALEFHNHDLSATFYLLREHGLQLFHH